VILPIDHAVAIPVPGLEDTGAVIESTAPHVDGFIVNYGVARAFSDQLKGKAVCLRTDSYNTRSSGDGAGAFPLFGGADAKAVGAHAMMNMLFTGADGEAASVRAAVRLVQEGRDSGAAVMIEALPMGLGQSAAYTLEAVRFAARLACELGADVVKTVFPTGASAADFASIVKECWVPVVVLGGAAGGQEKDLLEMVAKSLEAGAVGVAIGRNVWQHEKPAAMAAALEAIVHSGAGVDDAMDYLS
jgi:DhnA family fructose-bisphosphate aldolase class Ia